MERTLIRITSIDENEDKAKALLIGWRADEVISLDLSSVPDNVRAAIRSRFENGSDAVRTFVKVNLAAQDAGNLNISNWELPQEDPPID